MTTPADNELRDALIRHFEGFPFHVRAMFGGYGLYFDSRFFGVISGGKVYFRTDAENREAYSSRGMRPLQPRYRPRGPRTVERNFEVPADVLNDAKKLRAWAAAVAAAKRD